MQHKVGSYSPKVAVIEGDLRLIVDRMTGDKELYDSAADPGNEKNLINQRGEDARRLEKVLRAWHFGRSEKYYCEALWAERSSGAR